MKPALILDHTDIIGEIIAPLLTWYKGQAQTRQLPWREAPTPYHTWLSEIMLQQTRATAVIPYYNRFLEEFPDISTLANADEEVLMKLWQGLGYYSRARNLKKAAQVILQEHQGKLPQDQKQLLSLPGIGRYTANAIASIAYGLPLPAVDGNVLRVIARVITCREDIMAPRTRKAFEELLLPHYPEGQDAGALNQAFMDLGATICLPHGVPHCAHCPLAKLCLAKETGTPQDFPQKAAAKAKRKEERTILLIKQGNHIALHKRPNQGLLAGLWEFPNLTGQLDRSKVKEYLRQQQLTPLKIEKLPAAKHIFSHITWQLTGWKIQLAPADLRIAETKDNFTWATPAEIASQFSIPTAFAHYISYIK
ncbi:A/G-specific DNA-adenine glycosylase [Selenomonas sp. WCT3]|uniref:A/G-specific adenine glycosylase n=1 Tax=Selenomonas sp. WCT3 TaxID=3158785 RepID=UPI000883DD3E|nr:A/G-specific DNA-adenine glycosylase [Selenomonas ruminantium]